MEFNSFVFVGDYYPESGFCQPPSWQHNAVVANLETVIADAGAALRAKAYTVILDSRAYEHIAASRVCAFNIANNHVYDAGAEAFERMLARLESIESIQFYGIRERPHADIMVQVSAAPLSDVWSPVALADRGYFQWRTWCRWFGKSDKTTTKSTSHRIGKRKRNGISPVARAEKDRVRLDCGRSRRSVWSSFSHDSRG